MISDGQPNPFAFRILYPSLCGFLFCFFCSVLPSSITACVLYYVFCLVHTHPWPHLKTINFMWFFLYRAQSCSTTFPICMVYCVQYYYTTFFCIVCFVESWNIHIQQHNLAFGRCGWLFFFLFFSTLHCCSACMSVHFFHVSSSISV